MTEEQEDDDDREISTTVSDIIELIKTNNMVYKIIVYLIMAVIIISLMIASHNIGYGKGYNYVLDFKDDYIERYCTCFNSSLNKIQRPIGDWDDKIWASWVEDQSS